MELVYLWIEDYKNIKQQGFNFSLRFECEFKAEYEKDEDGKEIKKFESNILTQTGNFAKLVPSLKVIYTIEKV